MKQPYENLPKVWAWSNDKKLGDCGYHISTNNSIEYKHLVMSVKDRYVSWYKHIEPYKEPPKRPMIHTEVFKMIQENLSNGKIIYFKDVDGVITTGWSSYWKPSEHTYSTDLESWYPLEVEE